jgi:hypothetical protein
MSDVTQILSQIEQGDPSAAEQLLPLVYEELRKLAAAKLAHEKPGQTLQATALVHEVYLRLVDVEKAQQCCRSWRFHLSVRPSYRQVCENEGVSVPRFGGFLTTSSSHDSFQGHTGRRLSEGSSRHPLA